MRFIIKNNKLGIKLSERLTIIPWQSNLRNICQDKILPYD